MKTRFFAFIVLITVVVTGMFIWSSSYHNQNNDFKIPFVPSLLFPLAFSILTVLQIKKIVFATIIGVIIALIIKIIIDLQFDLLIISITSLIGAAIGFIYRKV